MFYFTKYRKIFYIISIILVAAALASIAVFGLNLGIEFTGGSLLEVKYQNQAPTLEQVKAQISALNLGDVVVQISDDERVILKMKFIDEQQKEEILRNLQMLGEVELGSESFQVIGSVIGQELKNKTIIVIILALAGILIYIAISFRKISRPVKSYVYGFTGVLALCHDIIIPLGIFAFLGRYFGAEITIPIITALLTVFGYSINDTVVVFDRIRENLLKNKADDFNIIIDQSLNQTFARSINTSFTVLLVLAAVLLFGGSTLRYFSLILFLGVGFGTYSSIFIASLLVVNIFERQRKRTIKR